MDDITLSWSSSHLQSVVLAHYPAGRFRIFDIKVSDNKKLIWLLDILIVWGFIEPVYFQLTYTLEQPRPQPTLLHVSFFISVTSTAKEPRICSFSSNNFVPQNSIIIQALFLAFVHHQQWFLLQSFHVMFNLAPIRWPVSHYLWRSCTMSPKTLCCHPWNGQKAVLSFEFHVTALKLLFLMVIRWMFFFIFSIIIVFFSGFNSLNTYWVSCFFRMSNAFF